MIKLYFFTILSFVSTQVFANYPPYDAVATSLGGSSVTYISPFSIEFNPANLCYTSSKISINAQNRYGIRQYSKVLAQQEAGAWRSAENHQRGQAQ